MADYQIIEITVTDKEARINVHLATSDINKAQDELDSLLTNSKNLTNKELDNDLEKLHIHLENNVTEAHKQINEDNIKYFVLTVNIKTN